MIDRAQASPRPQSARWFALLLACVLAIGQLLLLGHQIEHADAAGHADCALCVAGSPLDHTAVQRTAAVPATRLMLVPAENPSFLPSAAPTRRANARAPPPPVG